MSASFERNPTAPACKASTPKSSSSAPGEHDHELIGVHLENATGREDAVEPGHHDIHDHDIGPVIHGELNRFPAFFASATTTYPALRARP